MAIGTLALCYNNIEVFRGVVKLRRGKLTISALSLLTNIYFILVIFFFLASSNCASAPTTIASSSCHHHCSYYNNNGDEDDFHNPLPVISLAMLVDPLAWIIWVIFITRDGLLMMP